MSNLIYRVVLNPELWENDDSVDVFYSIGCGKTFTGFWTANLSCALKIYYYLQEIYFLDTYKDSYPCVVLVTTLDNVNLLKEFNRFKTDDNDFFDGDEVFVNRILNESLISYVDIYNK